MGFSGKIYGDGKDCRLGDKVQTKALSKGLTLGYLEKICCFFSLLFSALSFVEIFMDFITVFSSMVRIKFQILKG